MNATNGENTPTRENPSSVSAVADWNVVTSSHRNIPTMMTTRTMVARRRSSTQAPTVYMRDEQGDVADVDLGDAQGDAGEERQCHHDRDDLGESPSHRQWCGERHGVGERPRQIGGVVAVHARHRAERGAEDRGEQKPAGEPDVGAELPRVARGRRRGEQRVSFRT